MTYSHAHMRNKSIGAANWGGSLSHQCSVKMSTSQHNHPNIMTTVCLNWGCTAVKTSSHLKNVFNSL